MARCHELLRGAIDLHPHSSPSFFDRLLDEKDVNTHGPPWHPTTLDAMIHSTRKVGRARCVLATDYGQLHCPAPVEGMWIFVQLCLEQGISETEIRTMVADNPARPLGLG